MKVHHGHMISKEHRNQNIIAFCDFELVHVHLIFSQCSVRSFYHINTTRLIWFSALSKPLQPVTALKLLGREETPVSPMVTEISYMSECVYNFLTT